MTRWKYVLKQVALEGDEPGRIQAGLNNLGETGWEAVTWIPDPQDQNRGRVLMKMPSGSSSQTPGSPWPVVDTSAPPGRASRPSGGGP